MRILIGYCRHVLADSRRARRAAFWFGILLLLGVGGGAAGAYLWGEYHFQAGQRDLQRYRYATAQAHLEACLRIWPRSPTALLLAARSARLAGDFEAARGHLAAGERINADNLEALRLERLLLQVQRGGLFPEVESFLVASAARRPADTPLILEALALGYVEDLRLFDAQRCLDEWLRREPDNPQAFFLRGRVQVRLTKVRAAVPDFQRALDLDPERDEVRRQLAEALLDSGSRQEAQEHFERLRQRQPSDPAALLGLARCRAEAGELDEARAMLDDLLAVHADSKGGLIERGRVALELGQPAEAEKWLRRAVSLDPSDRRANYLLFESLVRQGKEGEARQQQEKANRVLADLARLGEIFEELNKSPEDVALHHELGVLYLRNGQEAQALRWFQRALQLDPAFTPTLKALAAHERGKGRAPRP
jgi:tetratricopeptide (TPR) repeat protein